MKKYIFVSGGVCSSLGKGIAATSLGNLLESRGFKIAMVKIDPYLNVDAGTMSPYQHGEVYVTDDGAETDLDLGNYARFTKASLSRKNSITTGQIYQEVIKKEREGRYLGKTVQVIPHITDEIKRRIVLAGKDPDVDLVIIEIGGTVGDIESIPFLEAARQFVHDKGKENILYIHLTLIPEVAGKELKTKPTQHSVKELREIGIQPDILICRSPVQINRDMIKKIGIFTNVKEDSIISAFDVKTTIYEIPLIFHSQKLDERVLAKLNINSTEINLTVWENMVNAFKTASKTVRIGIVGKYINLSDSYKSIYESIFHGGIANNVHIELVKIDAEDIEKAKDPDTVLNGLHGILIPGGFGQRGIQGMISAVSYARTKNIPCFGICLGMQVMVIEYARNVLGYDDADSTEFKPATSFPVISLLEEQMEVNSFGGTMRLGKSESSVKEGTKLHSIYKSTTIFERHRHRYEFSNLYREEMENGGIIVSALTPDETLVESIEWADHPWGIGVQFHPEFLSTPIHPHPLFTCFIKASKDYGKI